MTEQKARPDTLAPARKPVQPAPDEGIDPVDLPAAVKPVPRERRSRSKVLATATKTDYLEAAPKQREVVFPLSTRMGELPTRVLEAEVRRTGKTVRVVVEEAVMLAYGQDSKRDGK